MGMSKLWDSVRNSVFIFHQANQEVTGFLGSILMVIAILGAVEVCFVPVLAALNWLPQWAIIPNTLIGILWPVVALRFAYVVNSEIQKHKTALEKATASFDAKMQPKLSIFYKSDADSACHMDRDSDDRKWRLEYWRVGVENTGGEFLGSCTLQMTKVEGSITGLLPIHIRKMHEHTMPGLIEFSLRRDEKAYFDLFIWQTPINENPNNPVFYSDGIEGHWAHNPTADVRIHVLAFSALGTSEKKVVRTFVDKGIRQVTIEPHPQDCTCG